jgi:hypothetical protein
MEKFYVFFTCSKSYAGPFFSFQAAFSHVVMHKKDARIEDANEKVLATWSLWTGLYKVGAKYKYRVVDNEFNRSQAPHLIGQILDEEPVGLIIQEIEAA